METPTTVQRGVMVSVILHSSELMRSQEVQAITYALEMFPRFLITQGLIFLSQKELFVHQYLLHIPQESISGPLRSEVSYVDFIHCQGI